MRCSPVNNVRLTERGRNWLTYLVLLTVGVWLGLGLMTAYYIGQVWKQDRMNNQTQCQEDQDCWDCTSMGNGVCGP